MRLRALGAVAQATIQRTPARSFLDPYPLVAAGDEEQISVIEFRNSARQAQEKAAALNDETTAALFGKLTRAIDAQIWFLRSPSRRSGKLQPRMV